MAAHGAGIRDDQLPLKHVVLCSTSLSQDDRTRLAKLATEMGAAHRLDLTGDVTHLLVGDINTSKYKYVAKQRPDIKVLHPSWVEAIQQIWTAGTDVDLAGLDSEHQLPALAGLKLSVTGFIDTDERLAIAEMVKNNGAEYHGDMTKQVTHLIVAKPEGAKYAAAKAWGLATVSVKWLSDSLTRGMALDAGLYDPKTPEAEQGIGAFITEVMPRMAALKRARDSESQEDGDTGPRKLRRSASSRLQSHSQNVWQGISVEDSELQPADQSDFSLGDEDSQQTVGHEAPTPTEPKSASFSAPYPTQVVQRPQGFFTGLHVFLHGFGSSQQQRLVNCIAPNGGTVVMSQENLQDAKNRPHFRATCALVPHDLVERPAFLDDLPAQTVIATEWWVERCMRSKDLLHPKDDVMSRPRWELLIDGMAGMSICSSGFDSVDLRHVAKTVQANDATYVERLDAGPAVLISGSGALHAEKAKYAALKKVPVVTAAWLWDSFQQKQVMDIEAYKIAPPALDPTQPGASSAAASPTASTNQAERLKANKDPPARLSNTRKRHATPSLQLYASRATPATSKKQAGPFIHEDDDGSPVIIEPPRMEAAAAVQQSSQSRSQPLQDIPPNASPRQPARDQEIVRIDDDDEPNTHQSGKTPASPHTSNTSQHPRSPAKPTEPEYTADLQAIMEQRRASRPASSSGIQPPLQRLKSRRLGRATSGSSLNPRSLSGTSIDQVAPRHNLTDWHSDFADDADANAPTHSAPVPPSTQLGYDTPEAAAAKLHTEKRMGAGFSDARTGSRIPSLGTVKDSGASGLGSRAAGAAGRAKGRTRR
ncbi:DNA helicase [Oleoguttula sp. CCFEE 5521]